MYRKKRAIFTLNIIGVRIFYKTQSYKIYYANGGSIINAIRCNCTDILVGRFFHFQFVLESFAHIFIARFKNITPKMEIIV